ncbi:hypothetical protein CA13_66390 [Planctomycetes bacterium CA13]|uniref:Uncharacterized protein n=1 Tax=Novipirellula herctigrandis TaxID=2527986 RepID=A0A5C5ZDK9_9BACT|nr:hypothetical protein CA13_66390 [Planctomycetes bacterium CA13]
MLDCTPRTGAQLVNNRALKYQIYAIKHPGIPRYRNLGSANVLFFCAKLRLETSQICLYAFRNFPMHARSVSLFLIRQRQDLLLLQILPMNIPPRTRFPS